MELKAVLDTLHVNQDLGAYNIVTVLVGLLVAILNPARSSSKIVKTLGLTLQVGLIVFKVMSAYYKNHPAAKKRLTVGINKFFKKNLDIKIHSSQGAVG